MINMFRVRQYRDGRRRGHPLEVPVTHKNPFEPFLEQKPHLTCSERVYRGDVPAVFSMGSTWSRWSSPSNRAAARRG